MRFFIFGLLVLLALLFQITLAGFVKILGTMPDLILVLIALNGFLRGTREGAFLGLAAGLVKDIFVGGFLGVGALSGLVVGYLAGLAESRLYKENYIIVMGLVWLLSLAGLLTSYMLLSMAGFTILAQVAVFQIAIPVASYNALLVPLVYGKYYKSTQKGLLSPGGNFL